MGGGGIIAAQYIMQVANTPTAAIAFVNANAIGGIVAVHVIPGRSADSAACIVKGESGALHLLADGASRERRRR